MTSRVTGGRRRLWIRQELLTSRRHRVKYCPVINKKNQVVHVFNREHVLEQTGAVCICVCAKNVCVVLLYLCFLCLYTGTLSWRHCRRGTASILILQPTNKVFVLKGKKQKTSRFDSWSCWRHNVIEASRCLINRNMQFAWERNDAVCAQEMFVNDCILPLLVPGALSSTLRNMTSRSTRHRWWQAIANVTTSSRQVVF